MRDTFTIQSPRGTVFSRGVSKGWVRLEFRRSCIVMPGCVVVRDWDSLRVNPKTLIPLDPQPERQS